MVHKGVDCRGKGLDMKVGVGGWHWTSGLRCLCRVHHHKVGVVWSAPKGHGTTTHAHHTTMEKRASHALRSAE